jgi:hypothetical protein
MPTIGGTRAWRVIDKAAGNEFLCLKDAQSCIAGASQKEIQPPWKRLVAKLHQTCSLPCWAESLGFVGAGILVTSQELLSRVH